MVAAATTPRWITWLLFAMMIATVPVPFFMFVVAGLLPVIVIASLLNTGVWGFKLFTALHVVIYGPLFYILARWLARRLSALPPGARALAVLACVVAGLVFTLLPVYGVGHNVWEPVNLYRMLQRGRG